jgi:outer membrane lipoprotein-sorting protein
MKGEFGGHVVAVLQQRDGNDGSFYKVKVQRSRDGKSRQTTISPLRRQGEEAVDDGVHMTMYLPDDKRVIVQTSPMNNGDVAFRMPLVLKNYILTSKKGSEIAGRSTVLVSAMAKTSALGGIRFTFDEKTGFPMRKENLDDGESEVIYEVQSIEFPTKLEANVFKLTPLGGCDVSTMKPQKQFRTAKEAEATVGFMPAFPSRIPFGFSVQSINVSDSNDWRAVAMKLTDGLRRLTVYQWKSSEGERIRTSDHTTIETRNGIKMMVVSDLDSGLRRSILNSFFSYLTPYTSVENPETVGQLALFPGQNLLEQLQK